MSTLSAASRKLSLRMDNEVRDAFDLFDKDGDGRITRDEITDLIHSMGGDAKCPHVQELITAADENSTGSVDRQQFMALWKDFKTRVDEEEETEEEIKEAFKDYDTNGDGYITKDEMIQAMAKMGFVSNKEAEATKCMKDMDLNGDGRVSYAEFMVKWRVT